jgi:hypothetical protein
VKSTPVDIKDSVIIIYYEYTTNLWVIHL